MGYRIAMAFYYQKEQAYKTELHLMNKLLQAIELLDRTDGLWLRTKQTSKRELNFQEQRRLRAITSLKNAYGAVLVYKTKQAVGDQLKKVKREAIKEQPSLTFEDD